jgi:AcrR family transcriptional regulator
MTSRKRHANDRPEADCVAPADPPKADRHAEHPACSLPRRGRGRPRLDEASALTDTIVERALLLFRQQGFAATTMDEVAGACGSAKHSIYRRFSSKEELFSAAIALERQRRLDAIAGIEICALDPLVALRELALSVLRIALTPGNSDLLRICVSETPRFPVIASEFIETGRQIHGLFVPLIKRAQAEGLIIDGCPDRIARLLHHATVSEALLASLLGNPQIEDVEYWEETFAANWDVLIRGLTVRPERSDG